MHMIAFWWGSVSSPPWQKQTQWLEDFHRCLVAQAPVFWGPLFLVSSSMPQAEALASDIRGIYGACALSKVTWQRLGWSLVRGTQCLGCEVTSLSPHDTESNSE